MIGSLGRVKRVGYIWTAEKSRAMEGVMKWVKRNYRKEHGPANIAILPHVINAWLLIRSKNCTVVCGWHPFLAVTFCPYLFLLSFTSFPILQPSTPTSHSPLRTLASTLTLSLYPFSFSLPFRHLLTWKRRRFSFIYLKPTMGMCLFSIITTSTYELGEMHF